LGVTSNHRNYSAVITDMLLGAELWTEGLSAPPEGGRREADDV